MLLYSAITLFCLAALLGLYLFSYIVQRKETPKGIAFTHGPLGGLGIVLLLIYLCLYSPKPIIAVIILILAALLGFILIYRDLTGKSLPWWMALGHGLIAASGLITLIIFAFYKV